jgi:hypothetical protein
VAHQTTAKLNKNTKFSIDATAGLPAGRKTAARKPFTEKPEKVFVHMPEKLPNALNSTIKWLFGLFYLVVPIYSINTGDL